MEDRATVGTTATAGAPDRLNQLPLTAVRHNDAAQRRGVDQQFSRRAPPAAINITRRRTGVFDRATSAALES